MKSKTRLILTLSFISLAILFMLPLATAIKPIKVSTQGELPIHLSNQTGPITSCTTPRVSVFNPIYLGIPNDTIVAGEVGGGFYYANYTPNDTGTYRAHFSCSLGGNNYTTEDLFEVVNEYIDDKFVNITKNFTDLGGDDFDLGDIGYDGSDTTLKEDMRGLRDDMNDTILILKGTSPEYEVDIREISSSKPKFREFRLEVRPTGVTTSPDVFIETIKLDKGDILLYDDANEAFSHNVYNSVKGTTFIEFHPLLDNCVFENQLDAQGNCPANEFLLFLRKEKLENASTPFINLEPPKSFSFDSIRVEGLKIGEKVTPGVPLLGILIIIVGVLIISAYFSLEWLKLREKVKTDTSKQIDLDKMFGFKRRR